MNTLQCNSCDAKLDDTALYCHECGQKIKCDVCSAVLVKNAKFCSQCGLNLAQKDYSSPQSLNTLTFRKTKDETYCAVALTDEVGKIGIAGIIDNLTGNKVIQGTMLPLGTIDISEKVDIEDAIPADENGSPNDQTTGKVANDPSTTTFPHIHDVERNVSCSEPEWIAIYAFYASKQGKETFTKTEVQQVYLSKRNTQIRKRKFSDNWKSLFKHYFSTINDETFRFKPTKLQYLIDLILGNEKGSAKMTRKKTIAKKSVSAAETLSDSTVGSIKVVPKKKKSGSLPSIVKDLNLFPKNEQSLKEFYGMYSPKNNKEINLIFVYYLTQKLQVPAIAIDHIFTCYREIGSAVPAALSQSLIDTSYHKGWINTSEMSNIQLTTPGLNFLEQTMTKKIKLNK